MLGLLAFPATASAYSGNVSSPTVAQHAQLNAFVIGQAGPSSIVVRVSGSGFRSNSVVFLSATENGQSMFLQPTVVSATENGQSVFLQPTVVRTNRNGSFSDVVRIQLPYRLSFQQLFGQLYRLHPTLLVLHATGRFGQSASQVLLLNQYPYQYGFSH